MTNEFEELDTEESVPEQTFSDVPKEGNSMVSQGDAGEIYDWNNAPDNVKAPPRIDLNEKEVVLKKAELILPPKDKEWQTPFNKSKNVYKGCILKLFYDIEGQQEFLSGIKVFKREVNGEEKYSPPTISSEGKSQATKLLNVYATYKGKNIKEVSLREFMGFLNSQPKAVIKTEEVENPITKEKINKNFIGKFL